MLKDDRMMSMLTFVAIMIAVGTISQHLDVLERYFGNETVSLELQNDKVIVRPNALSGIDVLANDIGLRDGDADNLVIIEQPECGQAFVDDGRANYLPLEHCTGSQTFHYSIFGRSNGQAAEVVVTVRMGDPIQSDIAAKAQRDIALPTPAKPRALIPRTTAIPSLMATEAAAVSVSAAFQPPAVPKPQTHMIADLSGNTSAAVTAGGPMLAGTDLYGSGMAPRMTVIEAGLAETTAIAAVPVVHQPDQGTINPAIQASWAPLKSYPPMPRPVGLSM